MGWLSKKCVSQKGGSEEFEHGLPPFAQVLPPLNNDPSPKRDSGSGDKNDVITNRLTESLLLPYPLHPFKGGHFWSVGWTAPALSGITCMPMINCSDIQHLQNISIFTTISILKTNA